MTFDPNDPRLTAYVLGELEPADQRGGRGDARTTRTNAARPSRRSARPSAGSPIGSTRNRRPTPSTPETNHRPVAAVPLQSSTASRPWWRRTRFQVGAVAALLLLGATATLIPPYLKPLRQDEARVVAQELALANPVAKATVLSKTNGILRSVRDEQAQAPSHITPTTNPNEHPISQEPGPQCRWGLKIDRSSSTDYAPVRAAAQWAANERPRRSDDAGNDSIGWNGRWNGLARSAPAPRTAVPTGSVPRDVCPA